MVVHMPMLWLFYVQLGLPGELFGSEVAVEGHLDKILPVTGRYDILRIL